MTTLLVPAQAVAYLNHGRWLADCPAGCNAAMDLTTGQGSYLCGVVHPQTGQIVGGCATTAPVIWPLEPQQINDAVEGRPVANRNWAPAGHRQTYISRTADGRLVSDVHPDGQSAADLIEEGA